MKIAEIRKLKTEELTKLTLTLSDEIIELKRRLYSGEVQNTRVIRAKRKDRARVMTVLAEQLQKESV